MLRESGNICTASSISLLLCAGAISAFAYGQDSRTGYMPANDQGCKVWQPPQLHAPDFMPRYSGTCRDGLASGWGELQWLNRYASMRVSQTWTGYFHDGVYAGTMPFEYAIEPEPRSNEYIVHLGSVRDGDVVVFAGNSNTGTMDVCGTQMLGVSLNAKTPTTDDGAVKQAMTDAAQSLGKLCPTTPRPTVQVNAYAEPFQIDAHGQRTAQVASARLDWTTHVLAGYSNQASAQLRSKQHGEEQAAKLADTRRRFDDFSQHNNISAWVTAAQLDENPFRYEGKIVGIVVQMDRMLTPDTALVTGAVDGDEGSVQLHGITPAFPDSRHSVLMAVKAGKRETLPGSGESSSAFTSVTRIDSATCNRQGCEDWLGWARGGQQIAWGSPWSPAK
jgi:hypothetical protein